MCCWSSNFLSHETVALFCLSAFLVVLEIFFKFLKFRKAVSLHSTGIIRERISVKKSRIMKNSCGARAATDATVPQTSKTWGYRIWCGHLGPLRGLYQPSPCFCSDYTVGSCKWAPSLFWLRRCIGEERKKGKRVSFHLACFQTQLCYLYARIIQVRWLWISHTKLGLSAPTEQRICVCM